MVDRGERPGLPTTALAPEPGDAGVGAGTRAAPDDRPALVAFAVAVVVSVLVIRFVARDQWFRSDEWELLFERDLGDPGALFDAWNGHLVLVPTLVYKALYRLVGLHHYWPYQALTIAGHVGVVVCIRLLLRRTSVDPLLATAATLPLLLYGAGRLNLVWGFQFTLTGALALGLWQVLLVDHDGPVDRRDAIALGAGLLATITSGVGPVLVVVSAATAGRRRGARAALLQLPALLPYALWRLTDPRESSAEVPLASPWVALDYGVRLLGAALDGIGHHLVLSVALAGAVVVGGVRTVGPVLRRPRRAVPAGPAMVTLGLLLMAGVLGFTRGAPRFMMDDPPLEPRYLYLLAALAVPALAVGLDRIATTGSTGRVLAVAAVCLPVPAGVAALRTTETFELGFRDVVLSYADAADALDVRDGRPIDFYNPGLTAGRLAAARAAGRVPDPPPSAAAERATARLDLSLFPTTGVGVADCRPFELSGARRLDVGTVLRVGPSDVAIAGVVAGRPVGSLPLAAGSTRRVARGPVTVTRAPGSPDGAVERCG